MNIKSGLTVAAAIGALILIPVLVIVALGLYRESIGGVIGSANAQVDLSIRPNRGSSDSRVRIEGRNWPAKAEITVRLSRDRSTDAEEVAGIPLASALSSRSGAFAIELALPASFVSRETRRLLIQAESVGRDGRRLMSAPVESVVEPHDNAVEVRVTDAESGLSLEEANVKLRDALGRYVAIGFTDASGIARFDGIQPGGAAVEVSKIDYRRTRVNLSTPRSGVVKADMSLTADPGKRLVLPFGETLSNGQVRVTAVDRAAGRSFSHGTEACCLTAATSYHGVEAGSRSPSWFRAGSPGTWPPWGPTDTRLFTGFGPVATSLFSTRTQAAPSIPPLSTCTYAIRVSARWSSPGLRRICV